MLVASHNAVNQSINGLGPSEGLMISDVPPQFVQIPQSVKSSQSKQMIGGIIPPNIASAAASARNTIINSGNNTTTNQNSQFRPNSDLKNHILNLGNNNAKSLQASAAGMRSQHSSKDRLKQIMVFGGVASDEDLNKIKRGSKKK